MILEQIGRLCGLGSLVGPLESLSSGDAVPDKSVVSGGLGSLLGPLESLSFRTPPRTSHIDPNIALPRDTTLDPNKKRPRAIQRDA